MNPLLRSFLPSREIRIIEKSFENLWTSRAGQFEIFVVVIIVVVVVIVVVVFRQVSTIAFATMMMTTTLTWVAPVVGWEQMLKLKWKMIDHFWWQLKCCTAFSPSSFICLIFQSNSYIMHYGVLNEYDWVAARQCWDSNPGRKPRFIHSNQSSILEPTHVLDSISRFLDKIYLAAE